MKHSVLWRLRQQDQEAEVVWFSELDSAPCGRQNPAMLYYLGKTLELIGMVITLMALMAGLGLTPSGRASMGDEFMLLGLGAVVFTLGWWLERSRKES